MSFHDVSRMVRGLCVALVLFAAVPPATAQAPEPLFSDTDAPGLSAPAIDSRPFVVRTRTAALQLGALQRALASPATNGFTLNLFADATFSVTFERAEDSGFGPRTWTGHITDSPLSTVALTLNGDVATGMITDGTTLFEIAGAGDGAHRITQMDTSLMPLERDVVVVLPAGGQDIPEPAGPAVSQPALSTVDIFVYYSAALTAQLGSAGVSSLIAQYIANTNTAYARSGVDGQLRLVGTQELPASVEGANPASLLTTFAGNPAVLNQRNASAADLVALLVRAFAPPAPNFITCGIGHLGFAGSTSSAFTVTASRSECVHTFAHEVGHNLGGQHADEDGVEPPSAQFPAYARGYKAPDHSFRTIMAYDCPTAPSCPRALNFSNPAVIIDPDGPAGPQVTGTSAQRNASRLAELFPQVAAYRGGGPGPQPPGAPQNLQVVVNGSALSLSWQPGPGGAPTDYLIAAGTGPGLSNLVAGLPVSGTSLSASGIPIGSYWIRLYARNAAGIGGPSNEVNAVVGPSCTLPSAPRNFTFTKAGFNLTLSWLPPAAGGPSFIYGLLAGSAPGATNLFLGAIGSTTSIGGTVPAGNYFVRVIAANACGVGPVSGERAITIP